MDLRGLPVTVVEAAVSALRVSASTRQFVEAYPSSDADLMTDMAPAVVATIEAWEAFRVLERECEAGAGHSYEVVTDASGPISVACGHCSKSWSVEPAPILPAEAPVGPVEAIEPPPASPAAAEAPGAPKRALRGDLRAPAADVPEPAVVPDLPTVPCALCGKPVEDDHALAKANAALPGGDLCRSCVLTCELCGEPIDSFDTAVLGFTRFRKRVDVSCRGRILSGEIKLDPIGDASAT